MELLFTSFFGKIHLLTVFVQGRYFADMFRFLITLIVVTIFFILSLPTFLILWVVGKINPNAQEKFSRGVVRFAFGTVILLSGCKIDYRGLENIPTDIPVMYAANHNSFFDVIMNFNPLPGRIAYLAKKEFEKYFFLSIWMKYIKCLFLDRKDIKQGLKTIIEAIDNTKNGVSMFVFPEGTRSKDGNMIPFHEGTFKIAVKSGCPIIPVAISGTADVFENHLPAIKATNVIIEYGKPIYVSELSKEELKSLGEKTQKIIQQMLDDHKSL